jgi:hypothetical protein
MYKTEDIIFYVVVGLIVLAIILLIYKIIMWMFIGTNDIIITLPNRSQKVVPNGGCRPGFTKQGKDKCIKQCYEHSSLNELYKRPEEDILNPFDKHGVDARWGNIDSSKDYCYMCPHGFELGKIDDNDKKMYCTTRCPTGMMNNIQAQTCYKGYLLCPLGKTIEECEMMECVPGYAKQTNNLGQVVCVKDGAKCPNGMQNNDEYIGCWKDKKEAVISTVEDMYFLNSSDQDNPVM